MIGQMVRRLGPGNVLRRFPVSSALLLAGAALSVATHDAEDGWYWQLWLAAAFVAALAAQLRTRTQAGPLRPHVAAALAALAVGALMGVQIATRAGVRWSHLLHWTDVAFLIGGLVVLFPATPFLGRRFSIEALWRFGLDVLLATLVCLGAWLFIGAGIGLAGGSVAFLFDLDMPQFVSALLLAAPWLGAFLALGLLPADAARKPEAIDLDHGAVRLLLRFLEWVAVPLLLVHGAILNLYALNILVHWELPRGGVGWMVGSFAFIGTLVWLLAQAPVLRGGGGRLLRGFVRGWWWLLLAPFGLLLTGVWRRIADYGVTPPRYLLAEMTLWTGGALLLWVWRGARASNRTLVTLAGALLLFAALAGPFSARNLSLHSQFTRLQTALAQKGLLDARGRLAQPVPAGTWNRQEWEQLGSIMGVLRSLDAEAAVTALVRPALAEERPGSGADGSAAKEASDTDRSDEETKLHQALTAVLALDRQPPGEDSLDFFASRPLTVEVPGDARLVMGLRLSDGRSAEIPPDLRLRLGTDGVLYLEHRPEPAQPPQAEDPAETVVWRLTPARLTEAATAVAPQAGEPQRFIAGSAPLDISMTDGSRLLVNTFSVATCPNSERERPHTCIRAIDLGLLLPGR